VRENRVPALFGAILLHGLVLGAFLIVLPLWSTPLQVVNAVPVTIISRAPPEAPSAPVLAPEPTPPATPEPAPEPEPQQPPPPAPAPAPKPAPPPPAPPRPQSKPLDLNALANSLPQAKSQPNKSSRPASRAVDLTTLANSLPKSAGARGPARPASGPVIKSGPVRPLSGDEMGAVTAKLMRLWRPNCGAEGVGKVVVRVEMHLTQDGRLAGPPSLLDRPVVEAAGPVAQASAQRALTAVVQGEPYVELPRDRYAAWQDIVVRFDAKQACAGQ
jgi:outer membrane biosynthesis protein TonB